MLSIANIFGLAAHFPELAWVEEPIWPETSPYKLVLNLTWSHGVRDRVTGGYADLDAIAENIALHISPKWMTWEVWDLRTKTLVEIGFCPQWVRSGCKLPVPDVSMCGGGIIKAHTRVPHDKCLEYR
jgi:hypothetical protein